MSVLNLPRFVFSGYTDWNPDTVNNSASIYDEQSAEPVPQPGVSWDQFVAWLLKSNGSSNPAALQPNGSWNVFGDHGVTFMNDSGAGATITGITLPSGPAASDPLLGTGVQLLGLLYMDSPRPAPARLVDVEPYGPYSSQIFYENVSIGSATLGVKGRGACRMFSRWPNFGRNLGNLPIAGGMGVIWQTGIRNADLTWTGLAQSPALAALKAAAESGTNQGISVQFASYRTLYYQTVTYQGRAIRSGADLIWAYQNGFKGGNPARSILLGTIGVWGAGELASAPTQRLLAPNGTVTQTQNVRTMVRLDTHPEAAVTAAATPVSLGPAVAIVDPDRNVVTVDFVATFPEAGGTLEKANLGTFVLQSVAADGTTIQIGSPLPPAMYNRAAYQAGGGMAEFPFQASQRTAIANGTLQLVAQGSTAPPALLESEFLAETDQRGTYVDEGETGNIAINVYQHGAAPTTPVQLLAAQYDNGGNLITDPADRIVSFTGASATGVLSVTDGVATLQFQPVQAGCCYVFFIPFTGSTPPQPPAQGFGSPSDFFCVIRALPFDNALESSTPDTQLSFSFIYNRVLSTYDLIYPVMSLVRNLHDKNVVTDMAEQLKFAISLDGFQSTLYMPITRELSAGKRKLLQRYCNLLPNNVPPDPPQVT
jgi:hypothetical protein